MKKILITTATMDTSPELLKKSTRTFPQRAVLASLDDFTEVGVEGIVIAAPGALHAEQAVDALGRGRRIHCQKPHGRTAIDSVLKLPTESTLAV
jgi:predicted dehydrogenase